MLVIDSVDTAHRVYCELSVRNSSSIFLQ